MTVFSLFLKFVVLYHPSVVSYHHIILSHRPFDVSQIRCFILLWFYTSNYLRCFKIWLIRAFIISNCNRFLQSDPFCGCDKRTEVETTKVKNNTCTKRRMYTTQNMFRAVYCSPLLYYCNTCRNN